MAFFGPKKGNKDIDDWTGDQESDDYQPNENCKTCNGTGKTPDGDFCEDC